MTLNLIKLAVGAESIKDMQDWVRTHIRNAKAKKLPPRHIHITRMMPKRDEDLLAGGSLYWVIKGQIACRERLLAIEPFRDKAGVGRCRLVLEPKLILVTPRPMRAFQGWRYLAAEDAPKDLAKSGTGIATMPEALRRELHELGLL
jgi:hypothetical protein